MGKFAGSLLLMVALALVPVVGASASEKWEFSGMASYVDPDSERWDSDYGLGVRLGLLHHLSSHWAIELSAYGNALVRNTSGEHWQYGANPEMLGFFKKTGWRPYAALGVGLGGINTDINDRDFGAFWSGGVGIFSPPFIGRLKLRADIRYHHEFAKDGNEQEPYGDIRYHLGFTLPLGKQRVESEEPQVIVEVREVIVEREVVVEKPAEVKKSEVLRGVNFEISSASLTANARTVLREVAERLKFHSHIRVEIAGHTDSTGPAQLNERLSLERAESVKAFLVQEGVEAERLSTAGYGPSQPVASNDTAQGREENRRIEMRRLND